MNGTVAPLVDSLEIACAVCAAKPGAPDDGPFPAAQDKIFGTAFRIADDLAIVNAILEGATQPFPGEGRYPMAPPSAAASTGCCVAPRPM